MKLTVRQRDGSGALYLGEGSIRSVAAELERLRQQSGQAQDVLTSIPWFLSETTRSNQIPLIVLVHEGGYPYGAVLLRGYKAFGAPTGLFKAGYFCGRGAAIGVAARRPEIVEAATRLLFRTALAHTVVAMLTRCGRQNHPLQVSPKTSDGLWRMREMRSCLSLAGGMDGLTSRFSYKMRRNFRYYKRRAEKELCCVFLPQLTPAQSRAAVEALHRRVAWPLRTSDAMKHEAALRGLPGWFSMGLKDGSGNWLSFLSGWRQPGATYVEWQLNAAQMTTSSLSMVMRHYWLEYEVSRGTLKVIFLEGTSFAWSLACEPQICGDLLATSKGLLGLAVRQIVSRLNPLGQVAQLHKKAGTSFFDDPVRQ